MTLRTDGTVVRPIGRRRSYIGQIASRRKFGSGSYARRLEPCLWLPRHPQLATSDLPQLTRPDDMEI